MLFIVVDGLLVDATGVFEPGQEVKHSALARNVVWTIYKLPWIINVREHSGHLPQEAFHSHLTLHGAVRAEHQDWH